jgi:hypothetical protein
MTICAGAINRKTPTGEAVIHLVFDLKSSLAGGVISADRSLWKLKKINTKWSVMFSGDTSALFALRDAVTEVAQWETNTTVRPLARLCAKVFREERRKIIETDILANYDIESYSEYLNLKEPDRKFFDAITGEIDKAEEEWTLLFAGFDEVDEPHLFIISNFGKIEYCDLTGFACIGSGMWPAYASLAAYPYNIFMPAGEAIYSLLTAKFAAETSHGVGEATMFMSMRADDRDRTIPGLRQEAIERIKAKWKALPKIPVGLADELEKDSQDAKKDEFRAPLPKAKRRKRKRG